MGQLSFLDTGYFHEPIRHLEHFEYHQVPETPGAYILMAGPGMLFPYPKRQSSVFYIGKGDNLRARLLTHVRFIRDARNARQLALYWPMYEYGAAFGCRYTFVLAKPRERAAQLECDLLAMFAEHYRSWPVANGRGGWNSLRTAEELRRRR